MGSLADAASAYARVRADAPRSYYGLLAAARLPAAPAAEIPPPIALPDEPARALADDPDVTRVDTLWRLGLWEYAGAEMEDLALRSLTDPVKLFWLATAYQRQERYHLALRILRRHFAEVAASGHPGLPRTFWESVYPIAWPDDVAEAADRAGLDPSLVAAVVREESSFYPLAQSRAGARGLMQLLPQTARTIALRRGLDLRNGEALDEPGPNLALGTAVLADLLKEFTDPRLAVAAYNAGPGRVREWWAARRTSDVEAFVEQIPYDETRAYVKRVMVAWEEYRRLYGARLGR
jgi:soluble lytic murein transglycosylase